MQATPLAEARLAGVESDEYQDEKTERPLTPSNPAPSAEESHESHRHAKGLPGRLAEQQLREK